MADEAEDYNEDSAFDTLDESWNEGVGAPSLNAQQPPGEPSRDPQTEEGETSSNGSSATTTTKGGSGQEDDMPAISVAKRAKQRGTRRVSSSGRREREALQPGPSSPTMRKASHEEADGGAMVEAERLEAESSEEDGQTSPPQSSISKFSTSSEEKRGSHARMSVGPMEEEGEGDDEQFQSARINQSVSQTLASTGEEASCIEHSGFTDVRPFDPRRFKADMLKPKVTALQSMFDNPPPRTGEQQSHVTQPGGGKRGEGENSGEERIEDGVTSAEGEGRESSGEEGRGKESSGEEGRGKGSLDEARRLEEERKEGAPDWRSEERAEGRPGAESEGQSEGHSQEQAKGYSGRSEEGQSDHSSVEQSGEASFKREGSSEQEAREAEGILTQVPQCVFTFASPTPGPGLGAPAPPATPSHNLLRLLPRGSGQSAEIEQILNTPRSERRGGDVRKLVSKLVEQDQGGQERKRVRLDQMPRGEEWRRSEPTVPSQVDEQPLSVMAERRTRDYVRDAPALMERIRNVRLPSDSSSRSSVSSLVTSRRGAKAPTPESSFLRGRPTRPLGRGQSPRKMLRLWSAANQVDEEIEEEQREAEAAEDEWQDIPGHSPVEEDAAAAKTAIPIVSIQPPTQKGVEETTTGARETRQPGMLHIGPEDVDTEEMEHMARGRMTFDRAMGKWVPNRASREAEDRFESGEDSSDPFQDIESFASQSSMVKKVHLHAPRSQSALRNEVHLSDTTATTSVGSDLVVQEAAEEPPRRRHLAAPKTPQPPSLSHRSPTPRSILKTAKAGHTPDAPSPRSISFADGQGYQRHSRERVEKVEELLNQLAQLALGPDDSVEEMEEARQETPTRKLNFNPDVSIGARSPWNLSSMRGRGGDEMGNASFLTNASFNVAHDRIVELITDVAPWEPGWHSLKQIDLSRRRVDNLVRLKEFLPSLEEAVLDENEITYLTGLPSSVRTLSLVNNRLPPTVSFGHLMNLESLDISLNHIDESLLSLKHLIHLRHLRAESNGICSLDGIEQLSKLETLNLRDNELQTISITPTQWPRLKDLVLSHNRIITIRGISNLRRLRSLNLDHNALSHIHLGPRMSRLRQLRLSGNVHLASLDVRPASNLRTLYADDCSLQEVFNLDQLQKLDNLSLRQQNGDGYGINWPAHQIRDIKRLFLSGNAFRSIERPSLSASPMTRFYSMVYLELSACQLSLLPLDLSDLVPNLRHLNADYNLFESLPTLRNLHRLKRLSLIGCRISKSRKVVESLSGCEELVVLDVRMNPCTMGLYPPILLTSSHKESQHLNTAFLPPLPDPAIARPDIIKATNARFKASDGPMNKSFFYKRAPEPDLSSLLARGEKDPLSQRNSSSLFVASDNRFCRTLPTQYRLQRLLHRGALAMACPNLTWLDGLLVDESEVRQADDYFKGRTRHPFASDHQQGSGSSNEGASSTSSNSSANLAA